MTAITVFRRMVFVAVFWIGFSLPALAQGVGAIGGTVTDESGAVLPGATVILSSRGVIGGDQNTVSDGAGAYQFIRLVPGTYSVKAELQGFRSVLQENITVNADRTSRADLRLAIGDLAETITVAGESPLLDTTSAMNQTVMSREVLDTLPVPNDIFSMARLAPGLILNKYDVGGRDMIGQSRTMAYGSREDEYGYMIDGMDITSYAGGISFQVDGYSFEEVNYQASNAPAEWSSGGVVVNAVTKTGVNNFHGAGMFSGVVNEAKNIKGALREELLRGVPALALAANPNIEPGAAIEHLFDSAFNMSGPIVAGRLWFTGSARLGESFTYRVGSYNADGTQLLADYQLFQESAKMSLAVNANNQFHFMHAWVRKGRFHVPETGRATEFFDKAATQYNDSRNHLILPRWTSVLSSRMVVDVAGVTTYGNNNQQLQRDPKVEPGALPRYDSVTRTNTGARGSYSINNGMRTNFKANVSYFAGTHDVKFGYQWLRNGQTSGGFSPSHYPAGLRAIYRSGVPSSVETYNTPTEYRQTYDENSLYVQDKWTPVRKLTLNVGLRFETIYGWVDDGESPLCQTETIFIAGRCFPAQKGVPDWKSLMPRVSAIYDLTGDGRMALKFSANRYRVLTQLNGTMGRTIPIRLTNDTRPWTDRNGDLIPQLDELGASTGFNLGTTNRYADDIKQPYVNVASVELERELPGPLVVAASYHYRGHRDMIGSRNLLVPTSGYVPLTVTEVSSGRQLTVYNQDPATRGQFDVEWDNFSALDQNYHGLEISAQKRMRDRWMLMGSFNYGKTEGDIHDGADLNNPNFLFRRGEGQYDVPLFTKLNGVYEWPYGFMTGVSAQYYQGWPETTTVRVSADTVRLTQVNQTLVVQPRGTVRRPNVTTVDFNLGKRLTRGALRVEPRLEIFNLFNASAVQLRIEQLGPTYGQATDLLGARLIKLGASVSW